jgi:adenylate cyclase
MSHRRLSAIMFADIVGYTAMMQRNEQEGLAKVRHFSSVMETHVAANHGEILQFMGDGCLCIFHSAVQALHAAREIQLALKTEPHVPLRIGIHIGDIVMQEGNVYGDGVNLASRVESMGVSGSVLVTERVIHDVKSHPEFEMASLGSFRFKNVEKPMEIYALANEGFAVPRREEIKGKLEQQEEAKQTRIKLNHLILGLFVAGIFGYLGWYLSQNGESERAYTDTEQVIAVLPFRDLSEKQDQEYFCDGVAEELLNALAKLKGLTVRGRASSFSFKGQNLPLNEIASKLGATILLDGSIRKTQEKIRVNVQLLDGTNESPIWVNQYDKAPGDIFMVQEEIAQEVINRLQITLLPGERETLLAVQTQNPLAHEWYLKGVHAMNEGARKADEALDHLEKAVALDSTYYMALVELASACRLKAIYGGGPFYFEKSNFFAEKARLINPSMPEAYLALAEYRYLYSQDLELAEDYYSQAVKRGIREPNGSQTNLLVIKGQHAQAVAEAKALLANNPFSVLAKTNLSRINLWTGNYERVLEVTEKTLQEHPQQSSAMRHRGEAFLMLGKNEEALDIFEELTSALNYAVYGKVIALNRVGREMESRLAFQQSRHRMTATHQAQCFVEYQQIDSAFYYLENGIREKTVAALFIPNEGLLKPLHGNPRYKALLRKVGLPK